MKLSIQSERLEHLAEHRGDIDDALLADVMNEDSRTKPQSAKELREGAFGASKTPLVTIDNRSVHVNVDSGKAGGLVASANDMSAEELQAMLDEMLAAQRG